MSQSEDDAIEVQIRALVARDQPPTPAPAITLTPAVLAALRSELAAYGDVLRVLRQQLPRAPKHVLAAISEREAALKSLLQSLPKEARP